MTIQNEAARLFFAVSALILVGMLTAPTGGNFGSRTPDEISPAKLTSTEKKSPSKARGLIKLADRKTVRKILLKKS